MIERDNSWLEKRLELIWSSHFNDIERKNDIIICFGRPSRTRLGSIGMPGWQGRTKHQPYRVKQIVDNGKSIITITGHFKDLAIPEFVIDATIGHELVHYAHGFHSPHPQLYKYPHQGGVVDREMIKRGMAEVLLRQRKWLKKEWLTITKPAKRKRRVRARLRFL